MIRNWAVRTRTLISMSIVLCIYMSVVGCATGLSTAGAKIQDADPKIIEGCRYLGEVHGSSGWGNLAASTGIQNAKNEAIESAAALGATHIIWTNIAGGYSPNVSGRAYTFK